MNNKWVLSTVRDGFRIPLRSAPPLLSVSMSLSIFLPVSTRNRGTSQETGSGKGTRSGSSRFLFPLIDLFLLNQYIRKHLFKTRDSQFCTTINIGQRLDCLHRPDRCLPTCSDSSSIQEVSSVHARRSGLPIYGLTIWNVPKSVDFHKTDCRNSSALAST